MKEAVELEAPIRTSITLEKEEHFEGITREGA
jgi:hypothetical protein